MSTKYRFSENDKPHFITLTLVEWVDLFNRERYKEIVIESMKFCIENKNLIIHAYVIMSNHLHLIVRSKENENLADLIRDLKRFTAKKIYDTLKNDQNESRRNWMLWIFESQGKKSSSNEKYKIWRHENHPVILETIHMLNDRIKYIHENPIRAGICYTAEDYKYSSAGMYAGEAGLLNIEVL